mgnify:CR=1 FL=1
MTTDRALYRWKPAYNTGCLQIDRQHKDFLQIINRLSQADDDRPDFLAGLHEELRHYVAFHFTSEENLMVLHRYPDLERHRLEHRILLKDLASRIEGDRGRLVLFLVKWFVNHSTEEDRALARHMAGREAP